MVKPGSEADMGGKEGLMWKSPSISTYYRKGFQGESSLFGSSVFPPKGGRRHSTSLLPFSRSTKLAMYVFCVVVCAFCIRASVDALCRDGTSEISRGPRTKRLQTRRESLARPSKHTNNNF